MVSSPTGQRVGAETTTAGALDDQYRTVFCDASRIVDVARSAAVRSVNAAMTAAYWMIGQRIVEFEQSGAERAAYGAALLARLAVDLTQRFGRGFSLQNIYQMRQFYRSFPHERILQTVSGESGTASPETLLGALREGFPLPWSAYVKLLAVKNVHARRFYESEALRGGWSVRQLDRQINSSEGRRGRPLCARRPAEQGAGRRVSNRPARRRTPGGGNRPRARRPAPARPAANRRISMIDPRPEICQTASGKFDLPPGEAMCSAVARRKDI